MTTLLPLTDQQQTVLDILGKRPTTNLDIARITGFTAQVVTLALRYLDKNGLARRGALGWVSTENETRAITELESAFRAAIRQRLNQLRCASNDKHAARAA